jgi:hypothetical protein
MRTLFTLNELVKRALRSGRLEIGLLAAASLACAQSGRLPAQPTGTPAAAANAPQQASDRQGAAPADQPTPLTSEEEAHVAALTQLCDAGDDDSCFLIAAGIYESGHHDYMRALEFWMPRCGMESHHDRTRVAATACFSAASLARLHLNETALGAKISRYACWRFGTFSDPRQAVGLYDQVKNSPRENEKFSPDTMSGQGNLECLLSGYDQLSADTIAESEAEQKVWDEDRRRQDAAFKVKMWGIVAQGAGDIAGTIAVGQQRLDAARKGVITPPVTYTPPSAGAAPFAAPGGINAANGSAAATGVAANDPDLPECGLCKPQCGSLVTSCQAGGQRDCRLAAACLCKCNLDAGGCGSSRVALAQCVLTHYQQASGTRSDATPVEQGAEPPPTPPEHVTKPEVGNACRPGYIDCGVDHHTGSHICLAPGSTACPAR